MMNKEQKTKEQKWTEEMNKLKEQLKKSSKDQQDLKNENQKLRLRNVSSKVCLGLGRENEPEVVVNSHREEDSGIRTQPGRWNILDYWVESVSFCVFSLSTGDQQSSEEDMMDVEVRKTISNTIYNTLCLGDSQVQPSVVCSQEAEEESSGKEKGAREKRFSDGRLEVWYTNGNRWANL